MHINNCTLLYRLPKPIVLAIKKFDLQTFIKLAEELDFLKSINVMFDQVILYAIPKLKKYDQMIKGYKHNQRRVVLSFSVRPANIIPTPLCFYNVT